VPADGKQIVVDDDLTQLGLGDRLENELHPALCLPVRFVIWTSARPLLSASPLPVPCRV
jgi:hypothetical protein